MWFPELSTFPKDDIISEEDIGTFPALLGHGLSLNVSISFSFFWSSYQTAASYWVCNKFKLWDSCRQIALKLDFHPPIVAHFIDLKNPSAGLYFLSS
jgi:hypothetical protein